eukprot:Lithocolla_globosa_v1_NODE_1714_length_2385_cov_6.393562.p2 type:complete len:200 gc:universal NODE_1714_length_2385_cov_6.393562:1123-524(-)
MLVFQHFSQPILSKSLIFGKQFAKVKNLLGDLRQITMSQHHLVGRPVEVVMEHEEVHVARGQTAQHLHDLIQPRQCGHVVVSVLVILGVQADPMLCKASVNVLLRQDEVEILRAVRTGFVPHHQHPAFVFVAHQPHVINGIIALKKRAIEFKKQFLLLRRNDALLQEFKVTGQFPIKIVQVLFRGSFILHQFGQKGQKL